MDENDHWRQRLTKSIGRCFGRPQDPQAGPIWRSAEGPYLVDVNEKKYLDFRCGYSAINYGHTPQRLIEVAERQMRTLSQLTQLPSQVMIELAEQLLAFLGWQDRGKVLFNVSGARAVETSLKIALRRRPGVVICFEQGYHGRSLATQPFSDAATFSDDWPWPGIWKGEICRLPYPTESTLAFRPSSWREVIEQFGSYLESHASPLSAVLIEPMLGARGYVAPPDIFFQELAAQTRKHGGLVIADEVQVGLGRGGGRLMSNSQGWCPDLVVLGKSLGGGLLPISAVIGEARLLDSLPNGSESETFAGHPLACAIASESLVWLAELEPKLTRTGERLREVFGEIVTRWNLPVEVQGRGVVAVLDWRDVWPQKKPTAAEGTPAAKETLSALADIAKTVFEISRCCLEAGLLLHPSGPAGTRMVMLPPLTVTDSQMLEAGAKFELALKQFASLDQFHRE